MVTTIELGPQEIRWCRVEQGRIVDMARQKVSGDPIAALRDMAWPGPLGPTKILIRHNDILIRSMGVAPGPRDKMERILGFELRSFVGEEQYPSMRFTFRSADNVVGNDVRALTLLTKQGLIDELTEAVKGHGGKLIGISHPLTGLFQAVERQAPENIQRPSIILHGESDQLTIVAMSDGDILGAVTHNPGTADFDGQDGQAIGMSLAGAINAKLRMLKSQIGMPNFTPEFIFLSGSFLTLP